MHNTRANPGPWLDLRLSRPRPPPRTLAYVTTTVAATALKL